ncbi:unnamed protein product [Leptosia nina]|uniref:C2H2-type domain-containing protein n=1 Tax=Leptosia nina TaxID=320188 RepID=A0AAV1JLP5_9NEOP
MSDLNAGGENIPVINDTSIVENLNLNMLENFTNESLEDVSFKKDTDLSENVFVNMSEAKEDKIEGTLDINDSSTSHIKEETEIEIKLEQETIGHNVIDNPFKDIQVHVKSELSDEEKCYKKSESDEITKEDSFKRNFDIKDEYCQDDIVTYDYPTFDDSMDSEDATALGNVETCLQEVKSEPDKVEDKDVINNQIKEESDVTVTDTHLISNTIISTSTITNPEIDITQSETTRTLLMEIHPVFQSHNVLSNPEEILPTSNENEMDLTEPFQLNSITGNVLSLEQEAYGLLKAKKAHRVDSDGRSFPCEKCCKVYYSNGSLKKHLQVHQTIENYERGRKMMQVTRIKNSRRNIKNKKYIKKIKIGDLASMRARQDRLEKRMQLKELHEREKVQNESIEADKLINEGKMDSNKEGYECTCGQVFQRRSRMETCFRSHDIDMYETRLCNYSCMSCPKQFTAKDELVAHRRRFHRKRFPCKFCPTDYHTRKELFKHLRIHQKVQLMEYKVISEVMNGNQNLTCFMCDKSCSELTELKSHVMVDHKEPYICPKCNETFTKIIDFAHHTKTDHPEVEGQSVLDVLEAFSKLVRDWKCDECEIQFHEADKLAKHQVEMHSPELNTEMQYQCDDCRRVFISQKGLTSHRRIHHNTGSVEEAEIIEGVICIECRKICKDETALASHMRLHSLDRKYPCKFCDFRFATPEKRKTHAELHTGDMKYVCFICEYQCTSENRLRLHKMSEKHANMKEFLVSGQALAEAQKGKNSEEKIDNSSESSNDDGIVCDICGEKFSNKKKMLKHKETHPFIEFPNDDTPTRIFFK